MTKLPLKYGIPLLVFLLLASGYTDYGDGKTLMMILAMGGALWTAFSLPLPRRRQPDYPEEEEGFAEPPQDEESEQEKPSNGSGRGPIRKSRDSDSSG